MEVTWLNLRASRATPTTLWLITGVGPPPCATRTFPSKRLLMGRRELTNRPQMQARKPPGSASLQAGSDRVAKALRLSPRSFVVSFACESGDSRSDPASPTFLPVTLKNFPCPWLPEIAETHDFSLTRRHGDAKGAEFYLDALRYAQSQWISGKPAQAILQLNKAWMADLAGEEAVCETHPSPYRALVWIMRAAA